MCSDSEGVAELDLPRPVLGAAASECLGHIRDSSSVSEVGRIEFTLSARKAVLVWFKSREATAADGPIRLMAKVCSSMTMRSGPSSGWTWSPCTSSVYYVSVILESLEGLLCVRSVLFKKCHQGANSSTRIPSAYMRVTQEIPTSYSRIKPVVPEALPTGPAVCYARNTRRQDKQ